MHICPFSSFVKSFNKMGKTTQKPVVLPKHHSEKIDSGKRTLRTQFNDRFHWTNTLIRSRRTATTFTLAAASSSAAAAQLSVGIAGALNTYVRIDSNSAE